MTVNVAPAAYRYSVFLSATQASHHWRLSRHRNLLEVAQRLEPGQDVDFIARSRLLTFLALYLFCFYVDGLE